MGPPEPRLDCHRAAARGRRGDRESGFKLSKNRATQKAAPPGTNTNVPLVKRFDLRPVPDLVVVLSVSLTSAPGTITMCVQPLSEFLSSRLCEQQQSFEVSLSDVSA
jgi:hypothetical protein